MTLPLVYVAHPFGGKPANIDRAEAWVAWLCARFDAIFLAPWVPLCRNWPDSGETRKRGLELDLNAIERSDGIILVGGIMSPGMRLELAHAVSHGVSSWNAVDRVTPDELVSAGDGYDVESIAGWTRTLPLGRPGS